MTLNPKQRRFISEYLVDLHATNAAVRAGYSERTARKQGSRLLTYADVQAAIQKGCSKQAERTEINADWLLKRLADEANADVNDIYDEHGNLKPVKDWPLVWRRGLVGSIETDELRGDGVTLGKTRKIKVSDRVRRLELIGKHIAVGAFAEKHEHTGKGGAPLLPNAPVNEVEVAKRVAYLLASGLHAAT